MGVRKRKEDVASNEDTRKTLNIQLCNSEVRSAIQLDSYCFSIKVIFNVHVFLTFNVPTTWQIQPTDALQLLLCDLQQQLFYMIRSLLN